VRIELLAADQNRAFSTRNGSTGAAQRKRSSVPSRLVGTYQLRYVADTPLGATEFLQQVRWKTRFRFC